MRFHNGAEGRPQFPRQIEAGGVSILAAVCPGYEERCYLTADDVRAMRQRFDKYELELTGIGLGGESIKNQPSHGEAI
jgi:hypothetical protein